MGVHDVYGIHGVNGVQGVFNTITSCPLWCILPIFRKIQVQRDINEYI